MKLVAVAGAALVLSGLPAAPAMAAPGKPGFKVVHRVDLRGEGESSGLVLAGRRSGWTFWARPGPGDEGREFVARRWDGKSWRDGDLPAGLGGINAELDAGAAGPSNVWFVQSEGLDWDTGQVEGAESTVGRWDGRRWKVMRVFKGARLKKIAVLGASNIWAFGEEFGKDFKPVGPVAWHFDGSAWTRKVVPSFDPWVWEVGSPKHLWAADMEGKLRRFTGSRWVDAKLGRLLPKPGAKQTIDISGIYAQGSRAVVAASVVDSKTGWFSTYLLKWDGRRWTKEKPKLAQGRALQNLAPDGKGGLWAVGRNTSWVQNPPEPQYLFHRDTKGAWHRWALPDKAGRPFIDDIALLPGTKRLVAMGTDRGLSANGVIAVLK